MRKLIPLLLALVLCLVLSACDETPSVDSGKPGTPTTNGGDVSAPTTGNSDPVDPSQPVHTHTWTDATCTTPKTCTTCGATEGVAKLHEWKVEADTNTMVCKVCNETLTYSVGLEYAHNGDGTCAVVGIGTCEDNDIVIPVEFEGSKVTGIGEGAFKEQDNVDTIVIPDSVLSIAEGAFYRCKWLESVTIPSSITRIGIDAFYNCEEIANVYITNVTSWCNIVFEDFESNPLHFGACLYINGEKLAQLEIPNGITHIGDYTFTGCSSLESITIPNGVTGIGSYAFYRCSSLGSVMIPESVMVIGDRAFYCCVALKNINIPDSVNSFGAEAIYGCEKLDFNEYGNALYLGNEKNPFVVLGKVKSYEITSCQIHEKTKFINSYAFLYCKQLESIAIPNGVISIGTGAFSSCYQLEGVTIPNSVTYIGEKAFGSCESLEEITLPSGISIIEANTFYGCTGLKSILIPDGVISIGAGAFGACTRLVGITIPNSVISIGSGAFRYCSSLTAIYYQGAKEQFLAISRINDWDDNSGEYIIYCTDGEIKK